jgi:hypothetical protein
MEKVNDNIVNKIVNQQKIPDMEYKKNPSFLLPGSIAGSYYAPAINQQTFFRSDMNGADSKISVPTFSIVMESTGSKEDTDTARFNTLRDDFYQ